MNAFLDLLTTPLGGVLLGVAGLLCGSYAGLLSWRLPRDLPTSWGRSRCIGCERPLRPDELVPVLSWLGRRGRCACGRLSLPWRYPVIELITAAAFVAAWWLSAGPVAALLLAAAAVPLITMSAIDLEARYLPDPTVAALAVLGVPWALLGQMGLAEAGAAPVLHLVAAPVAAPVAFCLFLALRQLWSRLRGMEALGLGDVKLAGAGGLWLDLTGLANWMLLAGVSFGLFGLVWRLGGRGLHIPFGPCLAAGLFAALLLEASGNEAVLVDLIGP